MAWVVARGAHVTLKGPVTFRPDGRMNVALRSTADVTLQVNISALFLPGNIDLLIPAGEMRVTLAGPLLRRRHGRARGLQGRVKICAAVDGDVVVIDRIATKLANKPTSWGPTARHAYKPPTTLDALARALEDAGLGPVRVEGATVRVALPDGGWAALLAAQPLRITQASIRLEGTSLAALALLCDALARELGSMRLSVVGVAWRLTGPAPVGSSGGARGRRGGGHRRAHPRGSPG